PNTAVKSPGMTSARLKTEPTPVTTPHAMRHADVSGMSFGIGTACTSLITVTSANDDVAAKLPATSPPTVNGSVRLPIDCLHHVGRPELQRSQIPQLETVPMTTWSPFFTRVTDEPISST